MEANQMNLEKTSALITRIHTELDELKAIMLEGVLNTAEKWNFPEDNYTVLAIWLIYDPKAHILFPVNQKKSWSELAQKLTKFVGWTIDEHILRQNYTRKYLKIRKKE